MNEVLIAQIDQEIEASRRELAQDVIRLIGIKSVKGDPLPGAPFGQGPKAMLDAAMSMGQQEGFYTEDYHVGVISMALREGQPDLGIWLHGDVVPEGKDWIWPPYEATEYQGRIIGRGATDNKGQFCAMFHLMKIFKKLGISLNYNPALYVGSDEESGMHDMTGIPGNPDAQGFCNVCTPPRLSLVPDSGFPVGYGGNGSMLLTFAAKQPFHGISITAGQKDDPSVAKAVFGGNRILTWSPMRHPSNPDPKGNMITKLMNCLLAERAVPTAYRPVLEFFKRLSLDIHGDSFGFHVPSGVLKPLTIFARRIDMRDGVPELSLVLRYPITISAEEILRKLKQEAEAYGVSLTNADQRYKPYLLDLDWPVLRKLETIAREVTKEDKGPYTIGGGTYAHQLPNAIVYGTDAGVPPEGFKAGHGYAHGPDECVSLDRLQRAMRIYARALLALNEMDWDLPEKQETT